MKLYVRLLIGFVLIGALLYFVDWRQTAFYLTNTSPAWVILALLTLTINIPVSSFKWQVLLAAQGKKIHLWNLTRYYWIGTFFSNFLPTSFGGDAVRAFIVKEVDKKSLIAASIIWERVTGFFVLISWSALSLSLRPEYFNVGFILPALWGAVAFGFLGIFCFWFFSRKLEDYLSRIPLSSNKFVTKILQKMVRFSEALELYKSKQKTIFLSVILSIPFYVIGVFYNFFILISIDTSFPMKEIFFLLPIIPLVSLIPISFNGLGISEGAFVLFYSQAGLPIGAALAAAVIRRAIHLLISAAGGILWLPLRQINK